MLSLQTTVVGPCYTYQSSIYWNIQCWTEYHWVEENKSGQSNKQHHHMKLPSLFKSCRKTWSSKDKVSEIMDFSNNWSRVISYCSTLESKWKQQRNQFESLKYHNLSYLCGGTHVTIWRYKIPYLLNQFVIIFS